mmetsp:Transcript_23908/g.60466  ORF Transcript_23908/g.60466 Transcript_23908/m.60466 type:complete len:305 (+) Transcript_23908:1075-1989(+)
MQRAVAGKATGGMTYPLGVGINVTTSVTSSDKARNRRSITPQSTCPPVSHMQPSATSVQMSRVERKRISSALLLRCKQQSKRPGGEGDFSRASCQLSLSPASSKSVTCIRTERGSALPLFCPAFASRASAASARCAPPCFRTASAICSSSPCPSIVTVSRPAADRGFAPLATLPAGASVSTGSSHRELPCSALAISSQSGSIAAPTRRGSASSPEPTKTVKWRHGPAASLDASTSISRWRTSVERSTLMWQSRTAAALSSGPRSTDECALYAPSMSKLTATTPWLDATLPASFSSSSQAHRIAP